MKAKTKWRTHSNHWSLEAKININGAVVFTYLAAIETILGDGNGFMNKNVYIVTDLFGDYHPEPGSYFGEITFPKLKDAKAWAEKEVVGVLSEIVEQVKELAKGKGTVDVISEVVEQVKELGK